MALNLYGSLGGKGYANAKESKTETKINRNLASITPEKQLNTDDQSTEKAQKHQEPTSTTKKHNKNFHIKQLQIRGSRKQTHQMQHLTQSFVSYCGDLILPLMFKKKSMGITMVSIRKRRYRQHSFRS